MLNLLVSLGMYLARRWLPAAARALGVPAPVVNVIGAVV
jgi:hypothetical protein